MLTKKPSEGHILVIARYVVRCAGGSGQIVSPVPLAGMVTGKKGGVVTEMLLKSANMVDIHKAYVLDKFGLDTVEAPHYPRRNKLIALD